MLQRLSACLLSSVFLFTVSITSAFGANLQKIALAAG